MRWGRVVGGSLLIVFLALPCLIGVIAAAFLGNYYQRTHAVGTGRAPGAITFESTETRYVIALSDEPDGVFDGLTRKERREKSRVFAGEASRARCTITHADGSTDTVRGDRQGASTTVENVYETVGEFDGRGGPTTVECAFDPADDLLGKPTETPLMIHESSTWLTYGMYALLAALLAVTGAGVLLILWGTAWRGYAAGT